VKPSDSISNYAPSAAASRHSRVKVDPLEKMPKAPTPSLVSGTRARSTAGGRPKSVAFQDQQSVIAGSVCRPSDKPKSVVGSVCLPSEKPKSAGYFDDRSVVTNPTYKYPKYNPTKAPIPSVVSQRSQSRAGAKYGYSTSTVGSVCLPSEKPKSVVSTYFDDRSAVTNYKYPKPRPPPRGTTTV